MAFLASVSSFDQSRLRAVPVHNSTAELFEERAEVERKARLFADLLRTDRDAVVFTGAGVSTAASIADYRGPTGVWTLKVQGIAPTKLDLNVAQPTLTHRALVALVQAGLVRGVVTTNIDNLHLKAGMGKEHVAELHGNAFREICPGCGALFDRDYDVTSNNPIADLSSPERRHDTGSQCETCSAALRDTIVTFGENLPADEFRKAEQFCKGSRIALVLGTSLRVRPASQLPLMSSKIVIVNAQKTPLDASAHELCHTRCDLFMSVVMRELGFSQFDVDESAWVASATDQPINAVCKTGATVRVATTPVGQDSSKHALHGPLTEAEPVEVARKAVLLDGCSGSVTLRGNPIKVVIHNCTDLRVTIEGRVIGGVVEVIKSTRCVVGFTAAIPVVQIDGSKACALNFGAHGFGSIINAADCEELCVTDGTESLPIVWDAAERSPFVQFITRWGGQGLVTEQVVREGGGYATTAREKQLADAKDEKNRKILENYVRGLIK